MWVGWLFIMIWVFWGHRLANPFLFLFFQTFWNIGIVVRVQEASRHLQLAFLKRGLLRRELFVKALVTMKSIFHRLLGKPRLVLVRSSPCWSETVGHYLERLRLELSCGRTRFLLAIHNAWENEIVAVLWLGQRRWSTFHHCKPGSIERHFDCRLLKFFLFFFRKVAEIDLLFFDWLHIDLIGEQIDKLISCLSPRVPRICLTRLLFVYLRYKKKHNLRNRHFLRHES
jgi:hypothetical protein